MRQAALISQTLRAAHCRAYLLSEGGQPVILTSNPKDFADLDAGFDTEVVNVSPPPSLLPTATLTRGRWFRSILTWARSGSKVGRWLERTAKRLLWRLRYLDRLMLLIRQRRQQSKPPEMAEDSLRESAMYQRLLSLHADAPFDRIVVFDLFDLPVAVAFGADHDTEVIVR